MKAKYKVTLLLLILLVVAGSVAAYKAYNALYDVIPRFRGQWPEG